MKRDTLKYNKLPGFIVLTAFAVAISIEVTLLCLSIWADV